MSHRAGRLIGVAAVALCAGSSSLHAAEVVTHPYPGITHIKRTDAMTNPTRQVKMNIVLVDLNAAEVRFKMAPLGENLPAVLPGSTTPGWQEVPFETVRQTTLGYLESSHAQLAINTHFFAPFPVPAGSTQGAYAYLIGLAASRGNVYSAFETPFQIYAIVPDSPGVNIDRDNNASIVHRDPAVADGKHVLEDVTLWNALAGSAQIITDGVQSLPLYRDAAHPDAPLIGPGPANYSNSNSWYNLVNARAAIGLTQDNRTLVLFTVDVRPTSGADRSNGMRVGEVADVLLGYGVYNALNLDGGGSTTMAMQDPVDGVRKVINTPSDAPPGRSEGGNFAVYSDGVRPVTTAAVSPAPNANGWSNDTKVTVSLDATDERSGNEGNLPGWVDQIQHSLSGAQMTGPQVVAGQSASVDVTVEGITTLSYFATDAAGNDEETRRLDVRIDRTAPVVAGMPAGDCILWPPNHEMRRVAVVSASDALSGFAPGSLQVTATSDEAGADPSAPDVVVTADGSGGFAVDLRAERRGSGKGRRYTITATAKDLADNVQTVSATCTVPHDQGKP